MPRVLEQEVMTNPDSVSGYTEMTTKVPNLVHNFLLPYLESSTTTLKIADIGCGPCGYHEELYSKYPNATIDAYEASGPMLVEAAKYIDPQKTTLINAFLPDYELPQASYDLVISSMFLHQLPDATVNWNAIKRLGKPGATFVVYDLLRVEDEAICWGIVNGFTGNAPQAFKQDFFNTLRASFTVDEISAQLSQAGLTATISTKTIYPNCSVITVKGTL